jgi:hypothetical protein
MAKIKRELWKDGHYHAVLREGNKIISAPRWSPDKNKVTGKINRTIEKYNTKNYSHPLEAQTNYIILKDSARSKSGSTYHYKIFVPSNNKNGGYYATVRSKVKLSPSQIIDRSRPFIGGYGDSVNFEKTQIIGLEIYA